MHSRFLEGSVIISNKVSSFRQSPPYFSLYLHAFDAITVHLTWISQMHYGYKITHPDLVGTMASTVAAIEFIIGMKRSLLTYFFPVSSPHRLTLFVFVVQLKALPVSLEDKS